MERKKTFKILAGASGASVNGDAGYSGAANPGEAVVVPNLPIPARARRYGRAWRLALCGPRDSFNEIPLSAHSVEYRLEKAWRDGYAAAMKDSNKAKSYPAESRRFQPHRGGK